MNTLWHKIAISNVLQDLQSSENGLSKQEFQRRLNIYGKNKLPETKPERIFAIFLRQFQSPLIYILFLAAIIVFIMGEIIDGAIISAVLIFNAIVGTIQEGKAQNTLSALKIFSQTRAIVLRDKIEISVPDEEIVPGDILIIRGGDKLPADARIINSRNFQVDESALTGESLPVEKNSDVSDQPDNIISPNNIIFKGTLAVTGSASAVVFATGTDTNLGKISKKIATIDTEIPLKTEIKNLSKLIIVTVVTICFFLFMLGIFLEKAPIEMFTVVISLAVSVIPEGLPIVLTLVLTTGVWRMSKQNALIKKLQAVEALGQVKIIAVDKTGTVSRNEMMIELIYTNNNIYKISGNGYEPNGLIKNNNEILEPLNHHDLLMAGKIASLCSNAKLFYSEKRQEWDIIGDPTEASMVVLAKKIGFEKQQLENELPLIDELPFDFKSKYHATLNKSDDEFFLSVAGAPEFLLDKSSYITIDNKQTPFSQSEKLKIEQIITQFTLQGYRIIAYAHKNTNKNTINSESISDLSFDGLFAMADALRSEAKNSILLAQKAGIKVIMVTGDHLNTAKIAAKKLGILIEDDEIISGTILDSLSENELIERLNKITVFARVTPDHKLRIINAYKKKGLTIAMTGDGVNDAPSLVAADLGIAMGKIGTEVAKEASDIVLLDDNFQTIISAVEEGRNIYKTIKKVILYLFSTSLGEVLTIALALFINLPLPILAAQIIWLNFVTDGFLDVALAMEPKEKDLLNAQFAKPKKYLVDWPMAKRMILMSLPMALGTIFLFSQYYQYNINKAWTISLTTLAVFQWFNAWNCRHESKSIFQMQLFSNKYLVGATVIVVILQLLAIYTPIMQNILHTTSLTFIEWLFIIPIASSIIIVEEIRKLINRK